ncbi:hypothetical protein HMPREF1548_04356, partial [Clostridium sp. KLE 1755]
MSQWFSAIPYYIRFGFSYSGRLFPGKLSQGKADASRQIAKQLLQDNLNVRHLGNGGHHHLAGPAVHIDK